VKRLILLLLLTIPLGGCGTFFNMMPGRCNPARAEIYGGIQSDVQGIIGVGGPLLILCGLVDFPFSLVADTLTLPWTASHHPRPRG